MHGGDWGTYGGGSDYQCAVLTCRLDFQGAAVGLHALGYVPATPNIVH